MAQEKPWLVLLVPNDGGYGVLRNMQRGSGSREYAVDLHTPDFAKLADAIGVAHRVIRGAAEAEAVLADAVALQARSSSRSTWPRTGRCRHRSHRPSPSRSSGASRP